MGLLRLTLAICVLLFHCPPGYINRYLDPDLAVQCFYIISGFLIQLSIGGYRKQPHWYRAFYLSRAMRIFPLYWLFALLTFFCFGNAVFDNMRETHNISGIFVFGITNLFIFGQDLLRLMVYNFPESHFYFIPANIVQVTSLIHPDTLPASAFSIVNQSWSLAIELLFYLVAPFILTRHTWVLICVLAASAGCRIMLAQHGYIHGFYLNGVFPNELGLFMLGALAYRLYRFLFTEDGLKLFLLKFCTLQRATLLVRLSGICAIAWLINYYMQGWRQWPAGGNWQDGLFPVPYAWWSVLGFTALLIPFFFNLTHRWKWDRFLGELSYPVYISHIFFVRVIEHTKVALEMQSIMVLVATLMASVVLVYGVDYPMDRLRHHLFKKNNIQATNPTHAI